MQQRASIARALAFDADLLLMDEPFGALDEIVRDHLNEQLLKLWARTEKTIGFVTHSIPEAVYLSTKIVVMSPRPGPRHRRHRIDAAGGAPARHPRDAGVPRHRRAASATGCGPGIPTRIEVGRWIEPATRSFPVLTSSRGSSSSGTSCAVIAECAVAADLDRRAGETPGIVEFVGKTLAQEKPMLPAPHQVVTNFCEAPSWRSHASVRSLVYHAWVTLSATLLGFALGTVLGIGLAVVIVHNDALDRSLMPWIIASQTMPILAIAPMVVVVLAAVGVTGLLPKALISTYLSLLPGRRRHGEGPALARAASSST